MNLTTFLTDTKAHSEWVNTVFPEWKLQEQEKYPYTNKDACVQLDAHVKDLDYRIVQESNASLSGDTFSKAKAKMKADYLKVLRNEKSALFNKMNCANELEKKKLIETADIISAETAKYDVDVLSASNKERTKLIIIGGVILLIGTAIILKNKN